MSFKRGFTLAEVLITLSIIGVVAALTIPSLIVKNQEKETVVRLKKAYSVFGNAVKLTEVEYGTPDNWGWASTLDPDTGRPSDATSGVSSTNILNMMSKHLNLIKNCGVEKGCWHTGEQRTLNGAITLNPNELRYNAKARLADGTSLIITSWSNNCGANWGRSLALKNGCGTLSVDINGDKGPNQTGYDNFTFYITKYGLIPSGGPDEANNSLATTCANKTKNGNGCTAWVLLKENMDYLKRDISWNE